MGSYTELFTDPAYLVSRLILLFFRKRKFTYLAVTSANLITLAIATLIGSRGMADGGEPAYAEAFITYLIPVVIILIIDLIRVYFKQKPSKTTDETTT